VPTKTQPKLQSDLLGKGDELKIINHALVKIKLGTLLSLIRENISYWASNGVSILQGVPLKKQPKLQSNSLGIGQ
jgi:hypothetical protein